jgi:AcrR family transcriptional regulator
VTGTRPTSAPKPTRDEKKARTRRRLLDAAADVFARRGFAAASLDEVAEVAGFSKGAVYSNFASKEDLFLAVLDEHVGRQMLDIGDRIDRTRTAGEQVAEAGQLFMDLFQQERTWYLLSFEFLAYAARHPQFQVEFSARQRAQRAAIVAMITEHSEREQIELPMPADRMAVALEAVANGIAFAKLADASGVPDDLLGELFARLVLSPDDTAPDDTAPDETPA